MSQKVWPHLASKWDSPLKLSTPTSMSFTSQKIEYTQKFSTHIYLLFALHIHGHLYIFHAHLHLCLIGFKKTADIIFLFQTGSCHPMERKSRRCWKYLFCFAEPDFTPRQGHQHSAFVTAELQQASLVCRGVVGEAVGALLETADGGLRGRLKSFHPLLALPCGHVHKTETEKKKRVGWCMWITSVEKEWKREK